MRARPFFNLILVLTCMGFFSLSHPQTTSTIHQNEPAKIIHVKNSNWHQTIAQAPPHSKLIFDRNTFVTLQSSLVIEKPLILTGIRARLADGITDQPLIKVIADDVTITDFHLYGNRGTLPRKGRHVLLEIRASGFYVENGRFINGSKDGMMIHTPSAGGNIVGGVIKNLIGRDNGVDVVSIDGGGKGQSISNLLVENIRCYNSVEKGAVEVADGCENITVRTVYAENSLYAVDIQDHGKHGKINRNVVVDDVYALNCEHAVRTGLHPNGHENITLLNIVSEKCHRPLRLRNITNLKVHNVTVLDQEGDEHLIYIRECDEVSFRDITVRNATFAGPAMIVENVDRFMMDRFILDGDIDSITCGIAYQINREQPFSGLLIQNCLLPRSLHPGILLESTNKKSTLTDYFICHNVANIVDGIRGERAIIKDNIQ
ncbi:hypothetical protein GF406_26535 [candidate division KSB1 bacterium]|nr:hypothetical protein [candidate division KSB1 bacterium]